MSNRERGYRFENEIAKRYNRIDGWRAWRLGASSLGLPDIVAVGQDVIHVHELKTTVGKSVHIPAHQIVRCVDVATSFGRYIPRVILSARFGRKAEYHIIWDDIDAQPVTINIHGRVLGCDAKPQNWDTLLS